jgi:hypothetical protein
VLEKELEANRDVSERKSFPIELGRANRASRYRVEITGLPGVEPHLAGDINNELTNGPKVGMGGCGECSRFHSRVMVYLNNEPLGFIVNRPKPRLGENGYFFRNFKKTTTRKHSGQLSISFKVIESRLTHEPFCVCEFGGCKGKKVACGDIPQFRVRLTSRFYKGLRVVLTPLPAR